MNLNKTHRLTIVDKQYKVHKVRQFTIVKGSKTQSLKQKDDLTQIYPRRKAA